MGRHVPFFWKLMEVYFFSIVVFAKLKFLHHVIFRLSLSVPQLYIHSTPLTPLSLSRNSFWLINMSVRMTIGMQFGN
ncbi:hypothetical protein L1887_13616 [Cichorium endivia]|nr:hypothetical protein L1887_13616 [Cichorium endivia]